MTSRHWPDSSKITAGVGELRNSLNFEWISHRICGILTYCLGPSVFQGPHQLPNLLSIFPVAI